MEGGLRVFEGFNTPWGFFQADIRLAMQRGSPLATQTGFAKKYIEMSCSVVRYKLEWA